MFVTKKKHGTLVKEYADYRKDAEAHRDWAETSMHVMGEGAVEGGKEIARLKNEITALQQKLDRKKDLDGVIAAAHYKIKELESENYRLERYRKALYAVYNAAVAALE